MLHDCDWRITVEHERCEKAGDHEHPLGWGQSAGWALHLRRTMPMLRQTIVRSKQVFPILDPKARFWERDYLWEFTSGYRYQFGHCNDLDDWQQYMSSEFDWIGFDELTQFTKEQYEQIITRNRTSDPVLRRILRIRSVSNPVMRREGNENFAVLDPFWVRKRFVDPFKDGRKTLKRKMVRKDGRTEFWTYIYLPARLYDNPDKAFIDEYELSLLNSPPHIRLALLEGNWYITEGSFFAKLWNEQIHTCAPFKIPSDWPVFRSMDWGFRTEGCVHWWAWDGEATWYVFKELTFIDKDAEEVALAVKSIEQGLGLWHSGKGSRITGPADTQLWEKRGEKALSKVEEFLRKGIQWVQADKRSRASNAVRVSKLLSSHQHGTRAPGIVFFNGCGNIIRTLPAIQIDPNDPNEPLKGGEDHWYDSVSYGAAHASRGASYVGNRRPADVDDDDDDVETPEERGQYGYGSSLC